MGSSNTIGASYKRAEDWSECQTAQHDGSITPLEQTLVAEAEQMEVTEAEQMHVSMESDPNSFVASSACPEEAAASSNPHPEPAVRLKFPVVFGDGRQLTIQWDRGADPQQIAASFAAAHGIQSDEVPTIVEFIEHANAVTGMQFSGASVHEPSPNDELGLEEKVSKMDLQDEDENVKILVDMGLGDAGSLRAMLRANENNVQKVVDCLME